MSIESLNRGSVQSVSDQFVFVNSRPSSGPFKKFMLVPLYKNVSKLLAFNYFRKKVPLKMSDMTQNTPLHLCAFQNL